MLSFQHRLHTFLQNCRSDFATMTEPSPLPSRLQLFHRLYLTRS
ncbi:hypothetical protein IC575_002173 [Cucumis melo]